MEENREPRERTGLWLVKVITGALVIIFLGLHFVVNHLVAPEGLLNYADILAYYSNPIVPVVEVAFLITVIVHALIGFRSILLDLNLSGKVQRVLDILMVVGGSAAIVYGIWLVVVVVNRIKG